MDQHKMSSRGGVREHSSETQKKEEGNAGVYWGQNRRHGVVGKSWAFRAQALGTGTELCSPACLRVNVSKSLKLLCFDSLPAKLKWHWAAKSSRIFGDRERG